MSCPKIFILSVVALVVALYVGWNIQLQNHIKNYIKYIIDKQPLSDKYILFTNEELAKYNGVDNSKIYLSILGRVFDVTKGAKHYGPGQQYNIFVGRDSSRSFVTGKFCTEEASDRVDDFSYSDLRSLEHWKDFYKKEYIEVGKLIGTYYDEYGQLTEYHKTILGLVEKAKRSSDANELQKAKYPPCNVEWSEESGTRVWCTNRSGGIKRPWVGVPRQLYEVGSKTYRCACINNINEDNGNIKEYPDCPKDSDSCFVHEEPEKS